MIEKKTLKPEEIKLLEELGMQSKYQRPILIHDGKSTSRSFFYEVEDGELVGLNIRNSGFETLPENIDELKSLKRLNLSDNPLTIIPDSIGNLKSLEVLNLDHTNLTTLPESIRNLISLQILNLDSNNLMATLPESIGTLKSLKELYLRGIGLTNVPEIIGQLEALQLLDLDFNNLTSLPESLGNLKSLKVLKLSSNKLRFLPKSIGGLVSLQELWLRENELSTLPESIGNLKFLKLLILWKNDIITIPDTIGNLESIVELSLVQNLLISLPETIGSLKSLEKLWLADNKLINLPESIGNLGSLKELSLQYNELINLPRTFGKLEALEALYFHNNNFTSLPGSLWSLKNLKTIKTEGNPWDEESQEILNKEIPAILEFCRNKAAINVFLSHAVADFDYFNIKKISEYLSEQNEIFRAYYCEEDLIGHIDDFMNEKVPDSQLLLFFASQKSVFDSKDCSHELELARKHGIQIIPIKGADVNWDDLAKKGLARDLGFEFAENNFTLFCQDLFRYIKKFKAEVNLFEAEEARIGKQLLNIKNTINNLTESEELKNKIMLNLKPLEEIFKELNEHAITPMQYLQKVFKILFKNI